MRTSLRETKMLDDYSLRNQREDTRLLTEAKLMLYPELRDKLHWQQQVYGLVRQWKELPKGGQLISLKGGHRITAYGGHRLSFKGGHFIGLR